MLRQHNFKELLPRSEQVALFELSSS